MRHSHLAGVYAGLLKLYPRQYRERFASQMLLTFGDMCSEQHTRLGLLGVCLHAYADTFVGIIKENYKEVVMEKSNRAKGIVVVSVLATVRIVGGLAFRGSRGSEVIKPFSKLSEAREIASKQEPAACLADSQTAIEQTRVDDKFFESPSGTQDQENSYLVMETSFGLQDVPAGTQYETTINSYQGGIVQGSIIYSGDYGKYNYTIKKVSTDRAWEFVSMVPCE